ncbi:MAG: FadR family transcriptional regulator [Nocardia sp.]|nr:FadR family transcriptional regulator [Nocardia sp.]
MQTVRRANLIEQVTERLRAEIRSGRWPVGSRIPTEPELTVLTDTGRNTVREAVQALVHAGMLERRQGSGTYVIASSDLSGPLTKYFAAAGNRDVLELRQALDVQAARLAARRRDDSDVATLRALLDRRRDCWDRDRPAALEADVALHRAIVAASHNAIYLEFYDSLLPAIEQTIISHRSTSDDRYDREHTALVHAVIDGDIDRAARAADYLLGSIIAEYPDRAG